MCVSRGGGVFLGLFRAGDTCCGLYLFGFVLGDGKGSVSMSHNFCPWAYGTFVLVLLIALPCPVLSHRIVLVCFLIKYQGVHLDLLQHGQQTIGASGREMLSESYLLDKVEVGIKNVFGCLIIEHTQ